MSHHSKSTTDESPPHDLDAERSVLGSLMLAKDAGLNEVFETVADILKATDFYSERHQQIYRAACELYSEGTPPDIVTLSDRLGKQFEECGGNAYLLELLQSVPHAAHAKFYANIVFIESLKRKTLRGAQEVIGHCYRDEWDPELVRSAIASIPDPIDGPSRPNVAYRSLCDVTPQSVWWLWPDRIALGKLTLLAGDPGLGKSFLTIDVAARVSRGCPWPDGGDAAPPKGDVILLSAEDDPADTIRPRLDEAGGDPRRVHVIDGIASSARRGERPRSFCLETDLPALESMLDDFPETRLIVIDPISAYGNGQTDTHKNADVRSQLAELERLARDRRVAVLAVSHLNKSGGGKAAYRVTGSLAYVAAVRTAWLLAQDREDESRRLLLGVKNNIAQDPGGLAFTINGAGRVEWEPGTIDTRADDLVGEESRDRSEGGALGEAEEFLRGALADGARPAKELYEEWIEGQGGSKRTLVRARQSIGAEAYRESVPGPWKWRLPKDANAGTLPPSPNLGTLGTLGKNKEFFPISGAKDANNAKDAKWEGQGAGEEFADDDFAFAEPF